LQARLKQAEGAVREGTALRTAADQVRMQLLKTEQQILALRSDYNALSGTLNLLLGRPAEALLQLRRSPTPALPPDYAANTARPEFALLQQQREAIVIGEKVLDARAQPRVEAFWQGGLGRPNPFNMFETGFQPFMIVGLRAQWTPWDWGNRKREHQIMALQAKNLQTQEAALLQRLQTGRWKDYSETAKYLYLIEQDDAMIALQSDILRRAEAQVQNGIMTETDYLAQMNLLNQARLARSLHRIQAAQAQTLWRIR
jgi:outer membrane protein TolC